MENEKKQPAVFKVIKRVISFTLILFTLTLLTTTIIGYYYQDEVKGYIINELNKYLNTKIIVDGKDIRFEAIKNFPYASVDFKNVKALEVTKNSKKDTLFSAGEISLQFNLIDIFNKNYNIRKIKVEQGSVNIKIDKNGKDNFHFWKENSQQENSSQFAFALDKIDLEHVVVYYKNIKEKQKLNILINSSSLSGNFSNTTYSLEAESDIFIDKLRLDKTNYLKSKNILLKTNILVDNNQQSYTIKKGLLTIEKLLFDISGIAINKEKEWDLDLAIKGKDIDIQSILSLIPKSYKSAIENYDSDGDFYFNATIKGKSSEIKTPNIAASFGITNGEIEQTKNNIVLKNVNLKGVYSNGTKANNASTTLILSPFSVNIKKGEISGELLVKNFDNPTIDSKIKGDFQLEDLLGFFDANTVDSISGQLKVNASFKGNLTEINNNNYKNIFTQGDLELIDVKSRFKNSLLVLNELNGNFNFDDNDLIVNNLKGKLSESDFDLKGVFKNSVAFLIKENQVVTIDAELYSNYLNLNELLADNDSISESSEKYKLRFSDQINVKLNSKIKELVFRRFKGQNISGEVQLKNQKLIAENINLSTMNGNITVSGFVDGRDSTKFSLICNSTINKINVSSLFYQFEDFSQSSITDKNIKGIIDAKVELTAEMSPELQIDMNSIYATIEMTINNGELNNVESFKSLSKFIALEELSNIRFSTFTNSFEIKNRKLTIPKMAISSSALNLDVSGTHTFDNEIDYKIKLSLNELLSKKAKRAKKQNEEFGQVADDGLGRTNIFLSMKGTVDNPIIKYDKKEAITDIKKEIKEEKKAIRNILKEEFGLFKKDSTVRRLPKEKEDVKFKIEWEENTETEQSKKLQLPQPKEDEEDF